MGKPPFLGKNKYEVEAKILHGEYKFPRKFNKHAKDLIRRLLRVVPSERLGAGHYNSDNSLNELKSHPFFKNKKFSKIHKKTLSIKSLKGGFRLDQYYDYSDVYINEENVSDDESTTASIRSMRFKSIKKIKKASKKLFNSCDRASRRSGRKQKSKFFKELV